MIPRTPRLHSRKECRICSGKSVERFLHFPAMPFTDDFISPDAFGSEFRADIDIYLCTTCFTAQTMHDVDVGDYYEDYQYSVGGSTTASKFMRQIAESTVSQYGHNRQSMRVLEVGSGDGEQLRAFKDTGCRVLGYEPSSVLCGISEAKGIPTIQGLFTAESTHLLPDEFKEVDVIVLSYTFDHLPDPRGFLATARSILSKSRGILIVEIHDLEKIIERQEYCLFEHEHSIYLTEATVSQLCSLEGLAVIDFNIVPEADRRANSLIFVATPVTSELACMAVKPSTPEHFRNRNHYTNIEERIAAAIGQVERFVDMMTTDGRSVAGYGAGGRGVMTLAAMRNAGKLKYLVDKKPKGRSLLAPKSGVPLVGMDELAVNPVEAVLVFSYGYIDEIRREVAALGYDPGQFYSLLDILAGRF